MARCGTACEPAGAQGRVVESALALLLKRQLGMKRTDSQHPLFVRWEFERGERHLLCAINAADTSPYEVATVPLWDVAHAGVENFESLGAALQRHAAIVTDLRDSGWTLAAYTA